MTTRSAPCPCGSGLKYKRCHGSDTPPTDNPDEAAWQRVRQAIDSHSPELLRFVRKTYGTAGMQEAWEEFHLWDEPGEAEDVSWLTQLFMSWLQAVWNPERTGKTSPFPRGIRPVELYLNRNSRSLNPIVREYLQSLLQAQPSFWEILECEPGRGFRIRDIMLGDEHFVFEKSASENARSGLILFGFPASALGVWLMDGTGGVFLTPEAKVEIIRLREKLIAATGAEALTRNDMEENDLEVRNLWLDLAYDIMFPAPPHMTNSDGDELLWHTLRYDIRSADQAYRKLRDLNPDHDDDEDEENSDAARDPSGKVVKATIRWGRPTGKGEERLSLGTIRIDGHELIAEVNSAERAAMLGKIITKRLGKSVVYRGTEAQDIREEIARERLSGGGDRQLKTEPSHEELMQLPEVQEQFRAMIARHYESWVDTALPVLEGRTPREVVREAVGREQVEALIMEGEMRAEGNDPGGAHMFAWTQVRETLGLRRP